MTKAEVVTEIAKKTNISKVKVEEVLELNILMDLQEDIIKMVLYLMFQDKLLIH